MTKAAVIQIEQAEDKGCYDFHPGVELDLSRVIDEAGTFVHSMTNHEDMPISEHDVMVVLLHWIGFELVDVNQPDFGYDEETWDLFIKVFEAVEKLPLRRYARQIEASAHTATAVLA